MKTIKNSDIRFEINSRIVYVPSFEMKFYTVNQKEFFFKKTNEDVEAVEEESGDTKYYIDLDWQLLKYVGKGVLNYQCTNNIADPSFPDGEYNQLIVKATDYFIDTFTVEPEGDESITDMIEKEEEERKEADTVISGAVDTEIARAQSAETALQEAIDAETSARTSADETLNNAITAETSARVLADEALSQAIVDEASTRTSADEALQTAINNEATARTSADEALSGAVDTKLQDYYLKSETSGKTEIQTALDGKSDTGHTHDERYYRKDETSGATELEAALDRKLDASAYTPTDLSNYYTKDETSGKSEIASAISDLSGAVDTALLGYVNNAAYVSTAKTINLLHGETVIASVDATPFIKDGMVDNVVISGGSLVITFNTDSGKEAISIPLTDIFDPANYYNKTEIDGIVSGKADTTAVTQAITEATSGKANSSDVYLKSETSGKTEIATALSAKLDVTAYTPTDLSNYYTKSETSGKSEISTALAAKLDATAYTPTDLTNYYTKDETSGATELSSAFNAKQDTLVAGDNITISGNVISAAGGDLSNYYTKSEVDEMSEVAAQGINDLNTNKLDVTAYTPTDLTNYYTKSETSGKTEIQTALGTKQDTLVSGTNIKTVNNESLLGSGNITIQGGGNNVVELTQAEYDALTSKDPDTFYVITDATPIDLSNYYQKSETSGKTEIQTALGTKQDTLVSGTNIKTINNESILGEGNIDIQGGGGKAVSGGTNISITTGETADTINCTLNLENGTNSQSGGIKLKSFVAGNEVSGRDACAFGGGNKSNGVNSFVIGYYNTGNTSNAFVSGYSNKATNADETLFGLFALSNGSRTGDPNGYSDATLLAVGNGQRQSQTKHNAFEIRQNGDIYIADTNDTSTTNWFEKPMIKLQDQLGGGGSSINVVQTTGTSTGDVMSQDAVTSALSEKVNITDNDVSALTDFKVALKLGHDYTSDNISTFYLRRSVASNGSGALAYITTTDANYPSITINGSWNNNGITAITTAHGITSTVTNGVAQITITGGSLVKVDATASSGGAFIYKQYSSGQTADVVEGAVYDALEELSNIKLDYIYSNETINGAKTFLWGASSGKPIVLKQANDDAKIGFICQNSASTNNEIATFEFRPNTFTIDGVKHPLMYFGHYRSSKTADAGVPQTVIGFRQYDQANSAAYHMLAPLPEKAKTPFSLTTTFKDFYMPMGFKNGSTMVKADETGVVDLSGIITGGSSINVVQTTGTSTTDVMSQDAVTTALGGKADAADLGGLKLQQISQSAYDTLTNKDASTLYIIVG